MSRAGRKYLGRGRCAWIARAMLVASVATWAFCSTPTSAVGDATGCNASPNPITCENALPGTPASQWEVIGVGDPTIQGFATQMSVEDGQTISFKIDTPSNNYQIDIYRLGWYGGDGARLIQSDILPSASLPQTQPACLTASSTGEIDCGNWGVSASWTVPASAVSGVYIARLVRDDSSDPGGASQIPFVVTDNSSHSDILVPTDDATWEAYNDYGGNSLYSCTVSCPPGNPGGYKAAYAVSYNRPWDGSLATDSGDSYLWNTEYQMIQFLERNGYDVSYTDDANLDSEGSLLLNHKTLLFNGHDEYWSAQERANVTAARNAGVNLAFFTGNEVFWKTRWSTSIDGSNTAYRTLVTYKETHFNAPVDPDDPPVWTGAWADPRFSPPADGGNPANSLTGQMFEVDTGTSDITVPGTYAKLRLWANTGVASLTPSQSLTLGKGDGTLGYEWDVDADNGFRPAGEFDMSSTTASGLQSFLDYGTNTNQSLEAAGIPADDAGENYGDSETHHLTLYRASSGALVFGAGTVQWSWGLDDNNAWLEGVTEPSNNPPDQNMEQFTVNLLAMMGDQPGSLQSGLVTGSTSTDTTPPVSTITSPSPGASIADGSQVTITGTAADHGGGVVAGIEVSTDGGQTWHPATINGADAQSVTWSYSWIAHGYPHTTIESRATDDSANLETPSDGEQVNVNCPCSLWGPNENPNSVFFTQVDDGDTNATELGVQFTGSVDSEVTGIRFYKSADNTGTHTGSLWTANGTLLAQGTFTNETASGWQTLTFSSPVVIQAGQTYVAGYYAPNGHYAATAGFFYPAPAPTPLGGATTTSGPWKALTASGTTVNGLYSYTSAPAFPTGSYGATNYWVDPILQPLAIPGQATGATATSQFGGVQLSWTAPTTGGPATSYIITPYIGSTAQPTTTVGGSLTSTTVTNLTVGQQYTFTVTAANTTGSGPASAQSNSATAEAATVPAAPSGVSVEPASSQALVSWTAPNSGGSPIASYTITPYIGSSAQTPVQLNSGTATAATLTGLTNGTAYTFTVTANNAIGAGAASSQSSAVTPYDTLFDFASPQVSNANDSSAVNLGMQFTTTVNGTITGVRFYKDAGNIGTHVGSLWTAGGTLLAQGTFTNETTSGWQTLVFSSPVAVTAGTTYVVSYFAPDGGYSYTAQGFATAITNGPLTGLANTGVTPGNGLYGYSASATFPTNTYGASNYSVDVLFNPGGTTTTTQTTTTGTGTTTTGTGTSTTGATVPAAPSGVSVEPASSQALVSWTAPNSGGSPIASYTITPYIGSSAQTPVQLNSGTATAATLTGLTNGTAYTFTVTANNAIGAGAASSQSSAVTPYDTLFDFASPQVSNANDSSAVNLGMQFTTTVNGTITGVRFYKDAGNIGTHVGSLWTAGGTLLAQGTFTNETTSGWQTLVFSSPVAVTAGTTYVVSYFAPHGGYSYTAQGFATAITNGPLIAPASSGVTPGNGLYGYGNAAGFPNSSYGASNYSVDVLFNPGGTTTTTQTTTTGTGTTTTGTGTSTTGATVPAAPSGVSVEPASSQALVSWTAPNSGGSPIASYTITPYIGSSAQTPVQLNSGTATAATLTGLTNGTAYTFTVTANNAIGAGAASSQSSAVTPYDTLFDFASPQVSNANDSSAVNLGMQFTTTVNGTITGVRFYKDAGNIGTHVGSLWTAGGTLLAQGTFTNETTSGWQTLVFSSPVAVTAGTTYVVSYFAPDGGYSYTAQGFATAITNGPLIAPASSGVTPGNGLYGYSASATFPSHSYNAGNYSVDVLFEPASS